MRRDMPHAGRGVRPILTDITDERGRAFADARSAHASFYYASRYILLLPKRQVNIVVLETLRGFHVAGVDVFGAVPAPRASMCAAGSVFPRDRKRASF